MYFKLITGTKIQLATCILNKFYYLYVQHKWPTHDISIYMFSISHSLQYISKYMYIIMQTS